MSSSRHLGSSIRRSSSRRSSSVGRETLPPTDSRREHRSSTVSPSRLRGADEEEPRLRRESSRREPSRGLSSSTRERSSRRSAPPTAYARASSTRLSSSHRSRSSSRRLDGGASGRLEEGSSRRIGEVSPGSIGIPNTRHVEDSDSSLREHSRLSTRHIRELPEPPLNGVGSTLRNGRSSRSTSIRRPVSVDDEDEHSGDENGTSNRTEEEKIAFELSKALEDCSWEELYERIVSLQDSPEMIARALAVLDTDDHQSTLLHTMVWKAPPALTRFLMDLVTSPRDAIAVYTAQDADGNTPLHLYCANLPVSQGEHIDIDILKQLVKAAPRALQLQNSQGDSPLHLLVSSPACSAAVNVDEAVISAEEAVSVLLQSSAETALLQDSTGATPLHTAIASGAHEDVLLRLFEAKPEAAKVADERGMLPLHYAAAFGDTPLTIVELLVEADPDAITAVTVNGDTPLHILTSNASTSMAYLETGRMKSETRTLIELLLGPGGNDDSATDTRGGERRPLFMENNEKMNPLHCCALFKAPSQLPKFLIKNSPSGFRAASMVNEFGATPLHLACAQPSVAESVLLVAALGTEDAAGIQDRHKRTPLHVAAQNSHATGTLIEVLTDLYLDAASEVTQRGHLPLHLAAQSQVQLSVIKALINAYPKAAEARNKSNNTPLHDAAKYQASAKVVQLLLDTFPDAVYVQNQYGNLPLHCATAHQAPPEVVQLLLEAWPDGAAMQNRNQDAPLHYAAAYSTSLDGVMPLIEAAPAAVLLVNSSGQTPIDRAKANNAPDEIINQLEESAAEWTQKAASDGWGSFNGEFAGK